MRPRRRRQGHRGGVHPLPPRPGPSPGTAGLAFERLDLDGDGTLSVAELAAALWEFWTSEDAGALGNWLFGDAFLTAAD
ncbi:hypothetical protein ACFQ2M_38565 [Kitasatospora saccharophila]|uniref:hypothetical protein n=1 Tax=Kitasatospora saccharophila TaxID=407973 RepID=UPI00362C6D1E